MVRDDFRYVMSTFGTGLSVVAAYEGDEPMGFTCQALMSVSLDPPLVALCVSHRSTTWPSIRTGKRFAVNILATEQETLSKALSSGGRGKFRGMTWHESAGNLPWLTDSLAHIECDLEPEHDAGDHSLILRRVTYAGTRTRMCPLIYFRSRYYTVTSADVGDFG